MRVQLRIILFTCAVLLALTGCGRSTPVPLEYLRLFAESDLPGNGECRLYHGDVTGDAGIEIVLVSIKDIRIFDTELNLLHTVSTEEDKFGRALIADIDDDGKDDIVIGGNNEKSIRLTAYSGLLEQLFDLRYGELHNAGTVPHLFNDGILYFTAASELDIPPMLAGAVDTLGETVEWEYFTGPVPTGMSANREFTLFTVSNYPKNAAALTLPDRRVADHDENRSSLYLIDKNGNALLQRSLGDEFTTNAVNRSSETDIISGISQQFADLDGDGEEELIASISHLSDFFPGTAMIETYLPDGDLLNRKRFESCTELSIAAVEFDNDCIITVLQNQKGELSILDENLKLKKSINIPDFSGEAELQYCERFDDSDDAVIVVTDNNALYVFNRELEVLFSTAEPGRIDDAGFIAVKEGALILYTLADRLRLYQVDETPEPEGSLLVYTDPPGADIRLNSVMLEKRPISGLLKNLPAGNAVIEARLGGHSSGAVEVPIKQGKLSRITLEINTGERQTAEGMKAWYSISPAIPPVEPLKSWSDLKPAEKAVKSSDEIIISQPVDTAGGDEKDLIFRNVESGEIIIRAASMEEISRFHPPAKALFFTTGDGLDFDGNGKHDLMFFTKPEQIVSVTSADGEVLSSKHFFNAKNTVFRPYSEIDKDSIYLTTSSGYALQPRGVIGWNLASGKMDFFTPIAGMPVGGCIITDDLIIPAYRTPCNGAIQTLPDGRTVDDSHYFIHIINKQGDILPQSFDPALENNNGHLRFFKVEADDETQIFMSTYRNKYYPGPCELYRLDPLSGQLIGPLISEGDMSLLVLHACSVLDGEPVYVAGHSVNKKIFLLNKEFDVVGEFSTGETGPASGWTFFPDLNADGNLEIVICDKSRLNIYDHHMQPLWGYAPAETDGKISRVFLDDTNLDGKPEFIIVTDNTVSRYSW